MTKTNLTIVCLFLCSKIFCTEIGIGIVFPKAEVVNEHTIRIPFKLIDHLLVIEAEVLDQKGNFIIDTGSKAFILNKAHFPLDYPFLKKNSATSGVLSEVDIPLERKIKDFYIESLNLKDKISDVIDLSHIETSKKMNLLGIIGFDILKDYEIFIDLYLNQITLSKVDRNGNRLDRNVYLEKVTDSIDFTLRGHAIILTTNVNGKSLSFVLDSAAEVNQINKNVSKKALKYFIPSKRLKLAGASGQEIEVLAGKLHRVKLNDQIYFGPMYTILTNLSKMEHAFGVKLDGVLGYEFFKQKRTIINYQKEKLYFVNIPLKTE